MKTCSLVLLLAPLALAADEPAKPNVIVILADDMGYQDAGCYGCTRYQTPALDRLAQEGMRFTDFHASGPVCSPTRAGLLTGRYQQRAGIPGVVRADPQANRHHGLQPEEITFAELLRANGYATGMFGKWHLGYEPKYNPARQGFDEFRGYLSGNIDYFSHVDQAGFQDWWHGEEQFKEPGYSTHLITKHALGFIEQHKDEPFCLYIAHEAVHAPYQGPKDEPFRQVGQARINNGEKSDVARAYAEMMTEMDRGIGEVVQKVRELGLEERTFVFFFSDNGGTPQGSSAPLRGHKGSVWEGGHRVPAIAWWPGTIAPGSTSEATLISLDIFPTLLEITGTAAPPKHRLDGISFLPVLKGKKPTESELRTLVWDYAGSQAVRRSDWKLVQLRGDSPQLFNLRADLGEQTDLAEKHPDLVKQLIQAGEQWSTDVSTGATVQPERRAE